MRTIISSKVQIVLPAELRAIDDVEAKLNGYISEAQTERERVDVTLPGRRPRVGHLHPITLLRQKIEDIFVSMGYAIEDERITIEARRLDDLGAVLSEVTDAKTLIGLLLLRQRLDEQRG